MSQSREDVCCFNDNEILEKLEILNEKMDKLNHLFVRLEGKRPEGLIDGDEDGK